MAKEFGTKVRLLKLLLAIMEQPFRYTKKQLATRFGVNESLIKADFNALRDAGFVIEFDATYRYAFVEEKPMKELRDLLHFSEED